MKEHSHVLLRPHHIVCIQHFIGKGYDRKFVSNMKSVVKLLAANPWISVVMGADSLCAECPHNDGGICSEQERVVRMDAKCADILSISDGELVRYFSAADNIKNYIEKNDALPIVCGDCEWFDLCMRVCMAQKGNAG